MVWLDKYSYGCEKLLKMLQGASHPLAIFLTARSILKLDLVFQAVSASG